MTQLKLHKSKLIVITFVLMVFIGNPPWILFGNDYFYLINNVFLSGIFGLTAFILLLDRMVNNISLKILIYCMLLFTFFVLYESVRAKLQISQILMIGVFFSLFYVKDDEKRSIIEKTTSILAATIAVSLPLWLVNQFIYPLPMLTEMHYTAWKGVGEPAILENYFFFIQNKGALFNRFYSIFDEPGVLGTLSAFLLFINKYNFNDKRNVIILLGATFTYSLAFVIITICGMVLISLYSTNYKKLVRSFFVIFFIFVGILFFMKDTEVSQALFRLFDRFENLSSSQERRFSGQMNAYFADYVQSSSFFIGKGVDYDVNENLNFTGNGWKFYLLKFGLIGFLLIVGMYLFLCKKKNFITYSLLLLFFLSFFQRPHLETPWQLIIFSAGIACIGYQHRST